MELEVKKTKDRWGYNIYSARLVVAPNIVLEVTKQPSIECALDTIVGMCCRLESKLRHTYTENDTSELIKVTEQILEKADEHTFFYDDKCKRLGGYID